MSTEPTKECCSGCPDCGPTATKRTLEAITARVSKVSDGPWTAWNRGIGYEVHGPHGEPINNGHRETFSRGDAEFIAMAPGDIHYLLDLLKPRQVTTVEELDALPDDSLVLASGKTLDGDFTECWIRPVPSYISGSSERRVWETLIYGDSGYRNMTHAGAIKFPATVLYSPVVAP